MHVQVRYNYARRAEVNKEGRRLCCLMRSIAFCYLMMSFKKFCCSSDGQLQT